MKFKKVAVALNTESINALISINYLNPLNPSNYSKDNFLVYFLDHPSSYIVAKQHMALRGQKVIELDSDIFTGYLFHFILTRKEYEYLHDFFKLYLVTILKEMGVDYD